MRYRNILSIIVLCLICGSIHRSASAQQATLRQQILPLDCVFETINDGLGTIHYLTPTECGQVIPPDNPGVGTPNSGATTPTPTNAPATGTTHRPVRSSFFATVVPDLTSTGHQIPGHADESIMDSGRKLLLNNIADSTSKSGHTVVAQVGNVLFYRPVDAPNAAIRSITVTDIRPSAIHLLVQPINLKLSARPNQTIRFDKLQNGQPGVEITVQQITASSATLQIRLLRATEVATRQTAVGVQLVLLGVTLVLLYSLRVRPHWFRIAPRH